MYYKVNLEKFTGPLDFLLSLIEEKKLAINDVSLSQVTDQFLEYLKGLESGIKMTLEYKRMLAEFLIVASKLILIKSCSLLPNLILNNEEEEDIKDLKDRLEIYKKFKNLGRLLGYFAKNRSSYFSREYYFNLPVVFYPPKNISPEKISKIYKEFLKTLPQIKKIDNQSLIRVATIEEKIKELNSRISTAVEASFSEISGLTQVAANGPTKTKIDIILIFLAMLMLFKSRIVEVFQDSPFGDIKIRKSGNK